MIHGIDDQHVWEDKSVALEHVRDFLRNKLKLVNAESSIVIVYPKTRLMAKNFEIALYL